MQYTFRGIKIRLMQKKNCIVKRFNSLSFTQDLNEFYIRARKKRAKHYSVSCEDFNELPHQSQKTRKKYISVVSGAFQIKVSV